MSWLECLDWFSASHSNDATEEAFDVFVSLHPRPQDELIIDNVKYAQSVLIPEEKPLSEEAAHNYFECMRNLRLESSQVRQFLFQILFGSCL